MAVTADWCKRIFLVHRVNLCAFFKGRDIGVSDIAEISALPVPDFFDKNMPEFQSIMYSVDVDDWEPPAEESGLS